MNIGKLHSSDSRYSVPAVHPRLSVINASVDQRVHLIDAARGAGAQVVDQADADAAVVAEKQRRQEAHDLAMAAQQDRLGVAAAELELAISGEREAAERKSALGGAIAVPSTCWRPKPWRRIAAEMRRGPIAEGPCN